jgi:flavodoxin
MAKKGNKILIVYYSRTNNNHVLASYISKSLGCDIQRIVPQQKMGFASTLFTALLRLKRKIQPMKKIPSNYDLIIIATPVYAGNIPSPTRAYLRLFYPEFKSLAIISATASGDNAMAMKDIEINSGKKAKAILQLNVSEINKEKPLEAKLEEKHLKTLYSRQIKDFLREVQ